MKEKEIEAKYNIAFADLFEYIRKNQLRYSQTFTGAYVVDDSVIDEYVAGYMASKQEEKEQAIEAQEKAAEEAAIAAEEAAIAAEETARKKKAMAEMLITSGFSFDGYTITKYSGYISGDDAISVNRGLAIFGSGANVKDKLMESLVVIRRNALRELKEAAYALGCNAVIGVDFDYLTLDPQTANLSGGTTYQPYIFGVTANGNAVIIEKNK